MNHHLFVSLRVHSLKVVSLIQAKSSKFAETQVLFCGDNTNGIGVSLSSAPALNTDDHISFLENTQIDGFLDTPLESAVDIFLPVRFLKVWLVLWEQEWVYTAVQM